MKKITSALVFGFLFLASFSTIQAQVNIGARAGSLWANVDGTSSVDNLTNSFDAIRSNEFAVFAEIPVFGGLSIQPELAYTTKGFAYNQGANVNLFGIDLPIGAHAESRFRYIEAPLLAKYAFGDQAFKAYVTAGPTFGYATKGKLVTMANVIIDLKVGETPINLDGNNFQRFEVGGAVGGGLEYDAGFAKFFTDLRYKHGFTEVYDIPVVEERVRHQGFNLNVGFSVPINR